MKKLMILTVLLFATPLFATVSDGESVRQSFTTNGSTTTFTFTFKCNSEDDVLVYSPVIATGLPIEPLTQDVDYTIAPTSSSYLNGGVVTISPALASTVGLRIVRRIKQSQETAQGAVTPTTIEAALDKSVRQIQDAEDRKDRSLHIPESDSVAFDMTIPNAVDRAGKNLGFDASGNVTVTDSSGTFTTTNSVLTDLVTKSPWVDVRAFGAVGNGTADDSSPIQQAIDFAETTKGTVFFPPGTYGIGTTVTMDDAGSIWGPGATIKQLDNSDQTVVLDIDVASSKDITLFIKVDGNKDNNTAVEGIVLNGMRFSHGYINVTATECDTGIVVEGNTEANVMFLKALNCSIGVLERIEGGNTPDENTLFVSGHSNVTHYKKESNDIQITSVLHFSCETSSGYAVILEGGETILHGILRGCAVGGIEVTGDEDVAMIMVAIQNMRIMSSADVGWGVTIEASTFVSGSVSIENFAGGFWMRKGAGSMMVVARSSATLPAVKLGESGVGQADRFTILPGSQLTSTLTPALHFEATHFCDVSVKQVSAFPGVDVLFDTSSTNDTLRVNGRDTLRVTNNSDEDPSIEFYGLDEDKALADEATPSMLGSSVWLTGGTTTITDFDDGWEGAIIHLLSVHTVTISDNTNIVLNGNADYDMASGDTLTLIQKSDSFWYELARSANAVARSVTLTNTTEISSAQIKDLVGNPVTLVAAQGADTLIEFISAILIHDAGVAYGEPTEPDNMVIEYDTGRDLCASIDSTGFLTVANDEIRRVPTDIGQSIDLVPEKNAAVRLFNFGTDYTTGTGTMTVKTTYRVHTLGL